MKDEQKYLFDKQLTRFDFYINSVNTKAAFVIAFNTFIVGTLLFKYDIILSMFHNDKIKSVVVIVFVILVVTIGLSLWNVFAAVRPYLSSGNTPSKYHSLLFFDSIAEMSRNDYQTAVKTMTDDKLVEDLIIQTHTLATGASLKFKYVDNSIFWLLYFVVLPLAVIFALRIIDWIIP